MTPQPSFAHLVRMTDEFGMYEHADHTVPRREHGYCTDDMARLLVVACREPDPDAGVDGLATTALRFLAGAQGTRGDVRGRMNRHGRWQGRHVIEDCWGRSLWGLGTAFARSPHESVRQESGNGLAAWPVRSGGSSVTTTRSP